MTLKKIPLLLLPIICVLSLSHCGSVSQTDGAPDYHVDASQVPNAVVRPEPKSRYGNPSSYVVFGKRYHVMKSAHGFSQEGIASWYGTKFHARKTSSGEVYDLGQMTAAHKTLPLPTFVQVTNLRNNRQIVVKVNDRGPFEPHRIIDLSYVAAKKLDMLRTGTAPVKIVALNPATGRPWQTTYDSNVASAAPVDVSSTALGTGAYLQVGAFENPQSAYRIRAQLETLLTDKILVRKAFSEQRTVYRVQVGPYRSEHALFSAKSRLAKLGYPVMNVERM